MLRKDIKAGVVYAIDTKWAAPVPIVFLEDGAATLFESDRYGRGRIAGCNDQSQRPKRGSGWGESTRGYAALVKTGLVNDETAAMAGIIPAAELERLKAGERAPGGLEWRLVTSLADITRTYPEAVAAHQAQREADRAARERHKAERAALSARSASIVAALAALGIDAGTDSTGITLSLDDAEALLTLIPADITKEN
jgi:hypothetical protein